MCLKLLGPSSSQARATPTSRSFKKDENAEVPTARRLLDIANLLVKYYSFEGRESEPAVIRRPFLPITATISARANGDYFDYADNIPPLQAYSNKPFHSFEDHFYRGKLHSKSGKVVQMRTLLTPAPPQQPPLDSDSQEEESDGEIELSFEERRAGFLLPNTPKENYYKYE